MARQLKRFTDEQIERANRVNVVEYAKSQGLKIIQSGQWQKAEGMQGLYFKQSANTWHWETQDAGGTGSISLCMKLENKTWVEAVKTLLNEDMESIRYAQDWKPEPEPPKEFRLPDKNNTYRHVFAYLTKTRGIDSGVLKEMVDKGYIYENTQKSCVFVGMDKAGVARHASVRSTNTYGKVFKQDVTGSQKAFSFSISGTSKVLNVFEAPIDALSYMSLQKIYGKQVNDSYVALGGVTDKALERFLKDYPDIEKIRVCTDNDLAGEKAVERIYEKYHEQFKVTRQRPKGKDFNEDLVAIRSRESEKENINQIQRKPDSQPDLLKGAEGWVITEKCAAGEEVMDWMRRAEKDVSADLYAVKGNCNQIHVCDNPDEIAAHVSMVRDFYRKNPEYLDDPDYLEKPVSPDEYYAAYKSISNLQKYIEKHPEITHVFATTSRTEAGERQAAEIKDMCQRNGLHYDRFAPKSTTYAEDIAKTKVDGRLEERLQQAVNDVMGQAFDMQAAMVGGMEL